METCSSLLCPSAANLTAPSATPALQQNRKWASPYSWRTDHTRTTMCSGYCRVQSNCLACKGRPSILSPQIWSKSLHRMEKSFHLVKKPFPEKAYYEVRKRRLHWFKLGVNNKSGELHHWLPATHLGEPGWTEQTHIQDKLCRLDTQQGTAVPSVAVYMPVDISLTQGEEIQGETVAFLLPSHLFFCSELGRESGSQCRVHGALNRLALLQQTEEDAQHTLCLCCDTEADIVGLL